MKSEQSYAPYGWIISEDLIPMDGKESERGIVGPANIDPALEECLKDKVVNRVDWTAYHSLGYFNQKPIAKFRMSDADGEIYYVGYIAGEYEGNEPLDDFGLPNAGAIYIQYLDKNGQWSSTIEAN